ncbi:MAG: DNA mismatch endonuclease Vsr, partial [Silvibacterium sp.]
MADRVKSSTRSLNMASVRSKNTRPELIVRRIAHGLGYRYRLHGRDLPGKPDLVFRKKRKVVFVHGCFWHRHSCCSKASTPMTRIDF